MMMMMIIAMMMPFCNIHDGDKEGQGDETITMLMLKQKINMAQKVCHSWCPNLRSERIPRLNGRMMRKIFEVDEENI